MSLRDRLLASDPPLERLRLMLRATLAMLATGGIVLLAMRFGVVAGPAALIGVLVALWTTLMANDPAPRDRRVTAALLPLAAASGVAFAAALAAVSPILGALGLLAITFPCEWARRYGPRGFGLGMMALLTAFFTLWVNVPLAQVPGALLAIAIGSACAWLAHFVVVTDSPLLVLRSARIALRARMRVFAGVVRAVAEAEPHAPWHALRGEAVALDAAALAVDRVFAEKMLGLDEQTRQAARLAVLDAELAADRLAELAVASDRGVRLAAAPALDAFAHGDAAAAKTAAAPLAGHNALAGAVVSLVEADARAASVLDGAARARPAGDKDAPIPPGPRPPEIGGMAPTTRIAWQVTVAACAAMAIGAALPPHLPYWAVLTAYVVANQVASSGETRRRSIARVVGTMAGVAIGTALVSLLQGRHAVELLLILFCAMAALYAFRWRYWLFTFFLTALIAMAYDLVGRPADQLLLARLTETLIGGVCGGLAATFVVPLRTRAVVAATARGFADKLRASVHASTDALRGRDARPLDAARALDAQLQELLARVRPLAEGPRSDVPAPAKEQTLTTLADCAYRARLLAREALGAHASVPNEPIAAGEREVDAAVDAFADVLAQVPGASGAVFVPSTVPPDGAGDALAPLRRIAEDVALLAVAAREVLTPPA
ncbi:MAG TPA: FUSC family protein [Candidatus Sulfotelmatobacter sp.]|nr:FUSC family protein [Candidatus Sulfotelmatobacter sp.]